MLRVVFVVTVKMTYQRCSGNNITHTIVTDIHLETVLEIFFWRQVLFSFLSAVPSRYLSFISVDPDCYNSIQHLEMVFNT